MYGKAGHIEQRRHLVGSNHSTHQPLTCSLPLPFANLCSLSLSPGYLLCHLAIPNLPLRLSCLMCRPQRGVREHPELSVGSNTDGIEVRSVGNSPTLQETFLVEAFNLKVPHATLQLQLET